MTSHYTVLLLDLAFISKFRKPVTDQEQEGTPTKSTQQEPTSFISETTGSNRNDMSSQGLEETQTQSSQEETSLITETTSNTQYIVYYIPHNTI